MGMFTELQLRSGERVQFKTGMWDTCEVVHIGDVLAGVPDSAYAAYGEGAALAGAVIIRDERVHAFRRVSEGLLMRIMGAPNPVQAAAVLDRWLSSLRVIPEVQVGRVEKGQRQANILRGIRVKDLKKSGLPVDPHILHGALQAGAKALPRDVDWRRKLLELEGQ